MPEIREGDGVFEGSIDGRTVPRGFWGYGGGLDGNGDCMAANGGNARDSQGDSHERRESLSAQHSHRRNGRNRRPDIRLRPWLHRQHPPLPGSRFRSVYLHDLRGDPGTAVGALFAGRISNTIGRKRTMVIVALEYAVLFLSALGALGGSLTFGIFLLLSLFAIAFVYALAPETKGRHSKLSEPTGTTAVAGQTRRRRPKPGPTAELRRSPGERIFA
jgi:hypothetical protein